MFLTQKRRKLPWPPAILIVELTMKGIVVAPADQPASPGNFADLALLEKPGPLLIRATNGARGPYIDKKIKFSTVVEPDAIDAFYIRYAEVCKTGMTALKRRDRKKNKKKKATKTEGARTVT